MPDDDDNAPPAPAGQGWRWLWRVVPLAIVVVLAVVVLTSGIRDILSLETLVRHRAAIDGFIAAHRVAAFAIYIGLYIAVVALSVPGSAVLTLTGGFLFGTLAGGLAAIVGATVGAVVIFQIARSAFGEFLLRRAGPFTAKLASGFKADAFHYLLFLRVVPAFPFWLVNLACALFAVPFATFVAATAIGIIPAAFAFAFAGAGLDSVIAAQAEIFRACLASGQVGCHLDFHPRHVLTPQLLGALVGLGALALIPVAVKRFRRRRPQPPR